MRAEPALPNSSPVNALTGHLGAFLKLLHETIAQALRDGADADWVAAATARQAGWMHIQGVFSRVCYFVLR